MANWDDFVAVDAPPSGASSAAPVNWDDFEPIAPADELWVGEEVRGVGRAINRGGRSFIQSLDVTAMRQAEPPEELRPTKNLPDAKRDYEAFNAETKRLFEASERGELPRGTVNFSARDSERSELGMEVVRAEHADYLKNRSEKASKSFTKQAAAIEKLPPTQAQAEFAKDETPWWHFFKNPAELFAVTMAESLPVMAATVAAAPAGPLAVAAAAGVGSWNAESSGRVVNSMAKSGVDLKDPKAVMAWFEDRAKSNPELAKADVAALGPAALDAITGGLAGRLFLGPAIGKGALAVLAATAKETALQMAGGGVGSAAGSVLAKEPIDLKDIILEVFGELAPGEAFSNVAASRQAPGAAYRFAAGEEPRDAATPPPPDSGSAPPIEIARRPQLPPPPKPPRASVPETPPEERITAVEEIKRAKATTIKQIQKLFKERELTREEARVYRDLAWPTQKGAENASSIPNPAIVPEPEVRPPVGEATPLRQPGQAPAPQEAQAPVVPVALPKVGDWIQFQEGFPNPKTITAKVTRLANNPVPGGEPVLPVVDRNGVEQPAAEWFSSGKIVPEPIPPPSPVKPSEAIPAPEKPLVPPMGTALAPPVPPAAPAAEAKPPKGKPKGFLAQKIASHKKSTVVPDAIKAAAETGESMPTVPQTDDPRKQFGATLLEALRSIKRDPTISPKRKAAIIYAARWWVGQHPGLQEFRGAVGGERDARGLTRPAAVPGIWPDMMRADVTQIAPEAWQQLRDSLKAIWFRQSESGVAPGERAVTRDSLFDALLPFTKALNRAGVSVPDLTPRAIGIRPRPDLASQLRMPTTDELRDIINSVPEESRPLAWIMALHPTRINEVAPDTGAPTDSPRGVGLKVSAFHDDTAGPWLDLTGKRSKVYGKDVEVPITEETAQYLRDLIAQKKLGPDDEIIPRATFNQSVRQRFHEAVRAAVEKHKLLKSLAGVRKEDAAEAVTAAVFRKFAVTRLLREVDSGKSRLTMPLVELMSGDTEATLRKKYGIKPSRREFAGQLKAGAKPEVEKPVYPGFKPSPEKPTPVRKPRQTPRGDEESRGERAFDLIDAAKSFAKKISWRLIKEANPDWKPVGAAREIFAAEGEPADTAARALSESGHYKGDPNQVDQFGEAMNAAASARTGNRKAKVKEKAGLDEGQTQRLRLEADLEKPSPDTEPLDLDTINQGDKFKYRGVEFKVTKLDLDGDGRVVGIELENGETYGTQRITDAETLSKLQRDKGSAVPKLKPADKETGELLQGEDSPFNLTGEASDAETVAREKAEAEETARAKAEFEAKNQRDMFGGDKPPTSRGVSPENAMSRSEAVSAVNPKDAAGFKVEVISISEAQSRFSADEVDAANARGFFDPQTRTIYLIHDNISKGDAKMVASVVREEAGHGLLRTVDGNQMLYGLLGDGKLKLTESEKQALRDQGYGEYQLLDEFISKSAAENLPWWKSAVEQVRVWLSKVGLANLTNAEVSRMLVMELRRINGGAESDTFSGIPASRVTDPSRLSPSGEELHHSELPRAQHAGFKGAGQARPIEHLEPIREAVRAKVIDSRKPLTPDQLNKAWEIEMELTDPAQSVRAGHALKYFETIGGGDAGLVTLQEEIIATAVKAAAKGDDSLLRHNFEHSADFAIFAQGGGGRTQAGRAQRGAQGEGYNAVWNSLRDVFVGQRKQTAKSGTKVDQETFDELLGALQEAKPTVDETVAGVSKPNAKGQTVLDILEEGKGKAPRKTEKPKGFEAAQATADQILDKYAKSQSDTLSWKEKNWDTIKQVFSGLINGDVTHDEFRATLDSLKVDRHVAESLIGVAMRESDILKQLVIAQQRQRRADLWNKEQERLATQGQRTAERMLDNLEKRNSGADYLKGDKRNRVSDILKKAFSPTEPILQDPRPWIDGLRDELEGAGVDFVTATRLAQEVYQARETQWVNANLKAMERAATQGDIRSLVETLLADPYRSQSSPEWLKKTAVDFFIANGLPRERAEAAFDLFKPQFLERLAEAQELAARRVLERESADTTDEIVALIRSGVLDPSKNWLDTLAEKRGWKRPTPEQYSKLESLDQELAQPELSPLERRDIIEQQYRIIRHLGKLDGQTMRTVAESFMASLLSGPRTAIVQLSGLTAALRDFAIQSASNPTNAHNFSRAMKNAAVASIRSQAPYTWQKGISVFHIEEVERGFSQLERLHEDVSAAIKSGTIKQQAWARAKYIYAQQRFIIRYLNTADSVTAAFTREHKLAYYSSVALKDAGLKPQMLGELLDAQTLHRQAEYDRWVDAGLDHSRAMLRANATVDRTTRDFLSNKGVSDRAIEDVFKSAENDALLVVGRRGSDVTQFGKGSEGFLSRYTMNWVVDLVSRLKSQNPYSAIVAQTIFGFVAIPWRTTQFASQFGWYGLVRSGIDAYRRAHGKTTFWPQSFATTLQARARLREAIAGTAVGVAAGFLMSSTSDDDPDDKSFKVFATGYGPTNKNLRDAWIKRGFQPYALNFKINGRIVSVPLTRIGEFIMYPFIISASIDDAKWKQKERSATGKPPIPAPTLYASSLIGSHLSMMGQRGLLQTFGTLHEATKQTGSLGKGLLRFGVGTASGIALPFKQALAGISDMFVGPLDNSSAEAIVANAFPIVGLPFQQRAVNRFGDQLYDRSWYGKIARTGVPIAFQVEYNPENLRLYRTLIEKGIAPPELRRTKLEETYGEMSNSTFSTFAKRSGDMLKKATLANLSIIEKQSAEDAKKTLSKLASTADNVAAKGLGLERVTPARTASGGMSVPAASGSSGSLLGGNASLLSGSSVSASAFSARRASFRGGNRPRTRRLSVGRRLRAPRSRRLSASLRRPRSLRASTRRLTAGIRRPGMRLRRLALV